MKCKEEGRRRSGAALTMVMLALLFLFGTGESIASVVTETALQQAAEKFVRLEFAGQGELDVTCGPVSNLGDLKGSDLEIRPVLLRAKGRGPVHVALELYRGDERISRKVVTVDLQIFRDVLVATRQINRHEEIDPEFLGYERMNTRSLSDRPCSSPDAVIGNRATRIIKEGEPLLTSLVEEIPVIGRGDKVMLLVSVGGVTVTATGTALQDGAPGDAIPVRNDRGGKRLQCMVVSEGVVRVQMTSFQVRGG